MMIDRPRVEIELSAAEQWSASGPYGERALELARRSLQTCPQSAIRAVKVDMRAAPVPHSGLGAGTQLALAIAAGVRQLCQAPPLEIERLVTSVGRGRRSAVGSHGFQLGGLIWEEGRRPGQSLSDLKRRVEVPTDWRIVLVTMRSISSGGAWQSWRTPAAIARANWVPVPKPECGAGAARTSTFTARIVDGKHACSDRRANSNARSPYGPLTLHSSAALSSTSTRGRSIIIPSPP